MTNWNRKSTRFYSKKQENAVAGILGGKTTPNSGATPYIKGDVSSTGEDSWLIECKTCMTNKQSFAIKKQWLNDVHQDAIQQGKMNYALAFNFGPNQENYFIISERKFKEILEVENNND